MWSWFLRRKTSEFTIPTERTEYPHGLFVITEAGFFLIREKSRLRVASDRAMVSWSAPIVQSTESAVKHLPVLGKIGFRDGTLVQDFSNKKTYLISKNRKRLITSPDVIRRLGLNEELTVVASLDEVNLHEDGEVLS